MAGSERGVRGDLGCRGEGWVAWKCMSASQRGGRGGSRRRISPSYNVYVMGLDRAAGLRTLRNALLQPNRPLACSGFGRSGFWQPLQAASLALLARSVVERIP